ncbi:MAG: tRNA (adenosine(37)-N6)-threonylcarbamoyltransferase complex transferase subunit TsaD, partial [Bacteroidia bacterium]|nr:tRNA (adenosine(37)-N6)-threonylcarbamoyltransferase complex transferase subunit TsaD [Bacteroidia bacterium]MDW8134637.1 tRNA (adenosine(37)-N6)-threonylcarbamoyltransferase complex transferase subunit TsaD [Bacteroidia bacterium]
ALETSCDDTAACVYDGCRVLSHSVYRQPIHAPYGGVIPEWASREHELRLPIAVQECLREAGVRWSALHAVAAAQGPGLIGSLLIGSTFARAIAAAWNIPFIGVNHLEAHIASLELSEDPLEYPLIVLVATGGHTHLFHVIHPLEMRLIGKTQDDAIGEAFDKVAAYLGLSYPGGPEIEKLAYEGNPYAYTFPLPRTDKPWDFSFSGLKTAFLYALRGNPHLALSDLCASWQHAVFSYITDKLVQAAKALQVPKVGLVGGVAANLSLREMLVKKATSARLEVFLAPLAYCMDNAAMIAKAAWHRYINGLYTPLNQAPFSRG